MGHLGLPGALTDDVLHCVVRSRMEVCMIDIVQTEC